MVLDEASAGSGHQANVERVREMFGAFSRRDVEGMVSYCSPDVELDIRVTRGLAGQRSPYRGHEGIRQYFADVAKVWTWLEVSIDDARGTDTSVVLFGRARGLAGDVEVDARAMWTWQLRDGLVVTGRSFPIPDDPQRA